MGNTGNSTGTHLHLEASTTQAWQCSSFVDPCQPLGFPNIRGTIVKYDGTTPPIPTFTIKRKKFPWAVFTKIIRNRRTFF